MHFIVHFKKLSMCAARSIHSILYANQFFSISLPLALRVRHTNFADFGFVRNFCTHASLRLFVRCPMKCVRLPNK